MSALEVGFMGRIVPRFVSDTSLLADDLRDIAAKTYFNAMEHEKGWMTMKTLAIVTLATLAWDSFDHTMRTRLPVESWCFVFADTVEWITNVALLNSTAYDVRLHRSGLYVRVCAVTEAYAVHVVWIIKSSDVARASVYAALHPSRCCRIVEVSTRVYTDITVNDPDSFLP